MTSEIMEARKKCTIVKVLLKEKIGFGTQQKYPSSMKVKR
jgi:hypothetical protein